SDPGLLLLRALAPRNARLLILLRAISAELSLFALFSLACGDSPLLLRFVKGLRQDLAHRRSRHLPARGIILLEDLRISQVADLDILGRFGRRRNLRGRDIGYDNGGLSASLRFGLSPNQRYHFDRP